MYYLTYQLAQITNPVISGPQGESALGSYIGVVVKTILIIGAVIVLLLLAWGAITILLSAGDSKAQDKGKNIMTNAIIGLVILVALFPIIKVIEIVLNVSILNLEFPSVSFVKPAYAFSGGSVESGAGGWPFSNLGELRTQVFTTALIIGGLLVLALLIFGAIKYITSGGDKTQTDSAKKILTAAIVGLIILVAAYPIGWALGKVLGVPIVGEFNWPRIGGGGGNSSSGGSGSNNNGGGSGESTTGCYTSCMSTGCNGQAGFKQNTVFRCHDSCRSEGGMAQGCYLECNSGCHWVTVDNNPYDHCEC